MADEPPHPELALHDSLSRQTRPVRPAAPPAVGVYTSGPGLADPVHLGQWRTFVVQDLLLRQLARLGHRVRAALGLTDLEDATVLQAGRLGRGLEELTAPAAAAFAADRARLRLSPDTRLVRSSQYVTRAAAMVEMLAEKGLAYSFGNDIYFDPRQLEGFGKLSGIDPAAWPRKARHIHAALAEARLPRGDFALWHGWRPRDGRTAWDTDLGRGRPAFCIQEPATVSSLMGYTLDIFCGSEADRDGRHEASLAVMEALSCQRTAGHWLHVAPLTVNGRRMTARCAGARRLGEMLAGGTSAEAVRFFLLSVHYRRPLAFSGRALAAAAERLATLQRLAREVIALAGCADRSTARVQELVAGLEPAFDRSLCADLDLPAALGDLEERLTELARYKEALEVGPLDCGRASMALTRIDAVLQVLFPAAGLAANAA